MFSTSTERSRLSSHNGELTTESKGTHRTMRGGTLDPRSARRPRGGPRACAGTGEGAGAGEQGREGPPRPQRSEDAGS